MREQHVKWRDGLTQNKEAKQILRKMIEAVGRFGAAVLVAPYKDSGGWGGVKTLVKVRGVECHELVVGIWLVINIYLSFILLMNE